MNVIDILRTSHYLSIARYAQVDQEPAALLSQCLLDTTPGWCPKQRNQTPSVDYNVCYSYSIVPGQDPAGKWSCCFFAIAVWKAGLVSIGFNWWFLVLLAVGKEYDHQISSLYHLNTYRLPFFWGDRKTFCQEGKWYIYKWYTASWVSIFLGSHLLAKQEQSVGSIYVVS